MKGPTVKKLSGAFYGCEKKTRILSGLVTYSYLKDGAFTVLTSKRGAAFQIISREI